MLHSDSSWAMETSSSANPSGDNVLYEEAGRLWVGMKDILTLK